MKLHPKSILLVIFIGAILFVSWVEFWPLGLLKIVFCDVGQGDAIYIRFPNGRDMLVDGGPNNQVLNCLGGEMPFYDRRIDLVVLTHPQKDHLQGLIEVLKRYQVGIFVSTAVGNKTDGFLELEKVIIDKQITLKQIGRGTQIRVGKVYLHTIWPDRIWLNKKIAEFRSQTNLDSLGFAVDKDGKILGDPNTYSIYLHLQFQDFDLLLTGDGDISTQTELVNLGLLSSLPVNIEVLKVPHHGAATALRSDFLNWLKPQYAVIQVGKNSYGHPRYETLEMLARYGQVLRNDVNGKVSLKTDGSRLWITKEKN